MHGEMLLSRWMFVRFGLELCKLLVLPKSAGQPWGLSLLPPEQEVFCMRQLSCIVACITLALGPSS